MRFSKAVLVKVVIFSAICLVMTVALGVRLANRKLFTPHYRLEAEFTNALGVLRGDAVKIAGVDVGRVENTRIEDGKAIVEFSVEESVEVPTDSTLAIRWRNVLGQRFLYIYPGVSTDNFVEGERIPLAQTEEAGDIGLFLNRIGPVLRAIDPVKANAFVEAVNTALGGQEVAIRSLFDNGAVLAQDLAAMDREIGRLLESSDEILTVFADQEEFIDEILDDLDDLGGVLDDTTGDLNTVISNFDDVQREMDRLLKDNRTNIDSTLDSLEVVADTLADNKKNLARTLCTLPLGLASYFQTSSWGEWFNVRIVDVLVQDPDSKVIVSADELKSQRDTKAPKSYTNCADAAVHVFGQKRKGFENTTPEDPVTQPVESVLNMILPDGNRDG
jgi:phospholipid/cholesterol/gamma-HCH transport system substrate-binding protein